MSKKKAAKKTAKSKPDAQLKPQVTSLRRPNEPSLAEVSSAYFDRDEHFMPLHTIGMSAESVEAAVSDDKSPAAVRMRDAAKEIEAKAKQLDQFRADIARDDRIDVATRFMERTKVQAQAVEALEKHVNKTGQLVTDYINDMGGQMRSAWNETGGDSPMAPSEIRSHLMRLDKADQLAFIQNAIENGDGVIVNAALSAPPYMLGIEPHDHERLVTSAHKAFCPDAMEHRSNLLTAFDTFTRQAKAVIGAYTISTADAAHYDRTQKALKDSQERAAALAEVS